MLLDDSEIEKQYLNSITPRSAMLIADALYAHASQIRHDLARFEGDESLPVGSRERLDRDADECERLALPFQRRGNETETRLMKPTRAQLAALRLAAGDPDGIRYFKGGWYSTLKAAGSLCDPHAARKTFTAEHVANTTLRACVKSGWLQVWCVHGDAGIYACRWRLTDAGRAVIP